MHATSSSCIHSSCAAAYQGPKTRVHRCAMISMWLAHQAVQTRLLYAKSSLCLIKMHSCQGCVALAVVAHSLRTSTGVIFESVDRCPHRQDPFEYWAGSVQAWMGHGESRESGHTVLGSEYLLYFESLGAGRVEITVTTATLNHCMTQSRPIQYRIQLSDPAPCFLQRF